MSFYVLSRARARASNVASHMDSAQTWRDQARVRDRLLEEWRCVGVYESMEDAEIVASRMIRAGLESNIVHTSALPAGAQARYDAAIAGR